MSKIKSFLKKKLIRVRQEKVLIPYIEGHYLENRCAFTKTSNRIGVSDLHKNSSEQAVHQELDMLLQKHF